MATIGAVIIELCKSGVLPTLVAALIGWLIPSPRERAAKAQTKYLEAQAKIYDALTNAKTPEEKAALAKALVDHQSTQL